MRISCVMSKAATSRQEVREVEQHKVANESCLFIDISKYMRKYGYEVEEKRREFLERQMEICLKTTMIRKKQRRK